MRVRRPELWKRLSWLWRHPAALLLTLAFVVPGSLGAAIPEGDAGLFRNAGASMLTPEVWNVFASRSLQIGPLYLLALGVLTRLVEILSLPVLFTVSGLQAVGVTWLALVTARRLAHRTGADELATQWSVGTPLALGGLLAEAIGIGHPEEIVLGLVLANAAISAREGHRFIPGLLVGLATGTKLWGALGAPILLIGWRPGSIMTRCGTAVAVVTACYGPFFLFGEVRTFTFQWGLAAAPVFTLIASWLHLSDWALRVVQGAVACLAGAAAALRRTSSPLVVVIVVIAVRLLLEPLPLTYYSGPLAVMLLLWLWTSPVTVRCAWRLGLTAVVPAIVLVPYLAPRQPIDAVSTVLYVAVPLWVIWREHAGADVRIPRVTSSR